MKDLIPKIITGMVLIYFNNQKNKKLGGYKYQKKQTLKCEKLFKPIILNSKIFYCYV
jgi:hypothetical protein